MIFKFVKLGQSNPDPEAYLTDKQKEIARIERSKKAQVDADSRKASINKMEKMLGEAETDNTLLGP